MSCCGCFIYFINTMNYLINLYIVLFLFYGVSCQRGGQTNVITNSYPVIRPYVTDTVVYKYYVAEIQSKQHVEIRSKVKGFLEAIYVDEGTFVKKGDILFKISSREIEQELQKTEAIIKSIQADIKSHELEINNTRMLLKKEIVSLVEMQLAETRLEAQLAKLEEARINRDMIATNLVFTTIRAPFDGQLNRIPKKYGSLIEENELLTSISNNKEIFAYFNISEVDFLDLYSNGNSIIGKEVELRLANNDLYDQTGIIEIQESEFDQLTGNIAFRARFANPGDILKHGANGKVLIKTILKNALLVPQKSTFEVQDQLYVYVLNESGIIEQRTVDPKIRIPHYYILEGGLLAEEYIVYEGLQRLRGGETIAADTVEQQSLNPSGTTL